MSERLAFDTSRYLDQRGFAEDLASLAIEATVSNPQEKRINHFTLFKAASDKVVNSMLGDKDVSTYYSEETNLDRKEKEAGLKIRECLLVESPKTLCVWISPPGGEAKYDEGRMVVGTNVVNNDVKEMDSYAFPVGYLQEECLQIATSLGIQSDNDPSIISAEDLRNNIFVFYGVEKPWEFMRGFVSLDKVWDSIESGEARKLKEIARKQAESIAALAMCQLEFAMTSTDRIKVGARAEELMNLNGWGISSGPCGITNTQLLRESLFFVYTQIKLTRDGLVESVKVEKGKFVKNCGNCGEKINKKITKGYLCPKCGKKYEGC